MIILLCIQLITPVFPYTTLFRSYGGAPCLPRGIHAPSRRPRARARKHTARPAGRGYSREWIASGGGAAVEQRRFDIARDIKVGVGGCPYNLRTNGCGRRFPSAADRFTALPVERSAVAIFGEKPVECRVALGHTRFHAVAQHLSPFLRRREDRSRYDFRSSVAKILKLRRLEDAVARHSVPPERLDDAMLRWDFAVLAFQPERLVSSVSS